MNFRKCVMARLKMKDLGTERCIDFEISRGFWQKGTHAPFNHFAFVLYIWCAHTKKLLPWARSSDHCLAISIAWQLLGLNQQYLFFEAWYCSDILEQLSSKCFSSFWYGDVMIPCSYDVIVGDDALDFVNLSIFSQFFAIKGHASSHIWPKVVKKASGNVLKSLLVPFIELS